MLVELFITLLLVHSQVLGDTSSSEEEGNVSNEHEDGHEKGEYNIRVLLFLNSLMCETCKCAANSQKKQGASDCRLIYKH